MSTTTTSPRPSKATRRVPLWRRALPWAGGLLLFAGAIVALVVFVGNTANAPKETFSNEPAVDVSKPAAPRGVQFLRTLGYATHIEFFDKSAYVASGFFGLAHLDLSALPIIPVN